MDRGCRPLEFLSVDAVKVVGCFFRLRVQLVVDEGMTKRLATWPVRLMPQSLYSKNLISSATLLTLYCITKFIRPPANPLVLDRVYELESSSKLECHRPDITKRTLGVSHYRCRRVTIRSLLQGKKSLGKNRPRETVLALPLTCKFSNGDQKSTGPERHRPQ